MPSPLALLRFQVISAYLAADPPRGQRAALCQLKRDVPERSLDRLLEIATDTELIDPGAISRSTLHRLLKAEGISRRPRGERSTEDLDRFEAEVPNDLWQADMMAGPWLPDPDRPGKQRRAWLSAWLDDHSRLLVYGRFAFKQDLPTLELSFRQALRRCGVPARAYYDNGAVYRSRHMKQVCATLGIHRLIFTTPRRPEGHGKIEAFNRLCRGAFIAEVKASNITTLDELNRAFAAWAEHYYNRRHHSELNATPRDRWRAGLDQVRHVDEATLRKAFLWSEKRTTDKTGVLSLFGQRYQAGPDLARRRLTVRSDPEDLSEVELWLDDQFRQRARPLEIGPDRCPSTPPPETDDADDGDESPPVVDWLGHLVEQHAQTWTDPEAELRRALLARQGDDDEIVRIFAEQLQAEVFDEDAIRGWLDRYGPLDPEPVGELLSFAVDHMGAGQHIDQYLEGLRAALMGD